MEILYRKEQLNNIVRDFYNITKIQLGVLDTEFNFVARYVESEVNFCSYIQQNGCQEDCLCSDEEILRRCEKDKCAQRHICHAGLVDYAFPIVYGENIVGYIIMGRIRSSMDFEKVYARIKSTDIKKSTLKKHWNRLAFYNDEQIQSVANLAAMLVNYIISRDMVYLEQNFFELQVKKYLMENLSSDLSVDSLCKELCVSKNVLYKLFHNSFHCSVNEYITNTRINEAKRMLSDKDMTVSQVCETVSNWNYPYFCRLFKIKTGVTPLKYRKENALE